MQNLSPGRLAFLLATLVALGPLAIDTYLPALLAMSGHFAVEIHAVEVSVSVYVLGVAAGQWLGGPLSDQFGRKPVAYVGLTLFILGCLSIPLSSNIEMLYMLRFLQALGGGATVVIAAASVRDHFTGKEAAKVMTTIGLVMLVAPLVAPAVGALLLKLFGWQSIFYMLAIYGFMLFGIVRFLLPTVAVKPGTEPLRQRMFLAYGRVLSNRQAMGFILANGLAFAAMFTFITDAAFLYMEYFRITPEQFPLYFGANVVTMLGMNRLNVLLLRRYSSASIMQVALALQVAACLTLLGLTLAGLLTLWLVVPLIMVAAGMVALIMPNGIASFLDLFDRDSGAATGLNGALQFLLAGVIGTVLGMLHDGSTLPMTALMAASSVAAWVAFSLLARRQP
ncbi:MAG: multidrug effflux MFS transporter [Alcanivorax sp.]|uniref:multidrug effflux MFS transporter n=1 Tax=unclassified Alcanivorax TaxID=2638842 RepID=UPI0007B9A1FD|nr:MULTISPECIES: multidrug effflux MFS transporter [unclassified Alcanivorax]KZY36825.1 Bcr/CflA family drug resistance efflux transporter [Alcanivorax sp. HI0044]PHR67131.1 MAG: Bcr/CflA family drug resistance efflux transporter [Alcanivorax sp.]